MNHEDLEGLLGDYLDGLLEPADATMVEDHVAACEECRSELEALRALVASAAELNPSIEPPHDLWPGIDRRLDRVPLRERTLWSLRYPLVAATLALVIVSSTITAIFVGGGWGSASSFDGVSLLAEWTAAEASYQRAAAALAATLAEKREALEPGTIELIDRNLGVIDAARQESRQALAADPGNRALVAMLASIYEKKLDVLRQLNGIETRL